MKRAIGRIAAILVPAIVGTLAASGPAQAGAYVFTTFDPPNSSGTFPAAINKQGQVVGAFQEGDALPLRERGFVWTNGVFTVVDGSANATYTRLNGINDGGVVVGYYIDYTLSDYYRPLIYQISDGSVRTPDLGFAIGSLADVNNHNVAVGVVRESPVAPDRGITLRRGVVTVVEPPGQRSDSTLVAIANEGTSAGYFSRKNVQTYFTYAAGKATILPIPVDQRPEIRALSNGGKALGYVDGRGFVVDGQTVTYFSYPGASFTFPNAINQHGDIVGEYIDQFTHSHTFLLQAGNFYTIDLPAGAGISAMNNEGTMIGGYYPGGPEITHGFIATCPPDQRPCTH